MGDKEIQIMPELWRFEREKGGLEPQKTVLRKEHEELPLTGNDFILNFSCLGSSSEFAYQTKVVMPKV